MSADFRFKNLIERRGVWTLPRPLDFISTMGQHIHMKITLPLIHKFSKNWSKLTALITGGALVLALIQPVFSADLETFPDSFGSSSTNTVSGWVEYEEENSDAKISTSDSRTESATTGHVRLGDGASITKTVNTQGYENIKIEYYWRGDDDGEDAQGNRDTLDVLWRVSGASDFTPINEHLLRCDKNNYPSCAWSSLISASLPSTADDTSIEIKFLGNSNHDNDEEARVDDVKVSGDSIPPAPTNTPPSFDPISNQAVNENSSSQEVIITNISPSTSPVEESGQTVAMTASSSDPSIIPNPVFSGSGATRMLTYTPEANENGTVTITVTADDGQEANNTFSRTFSITVNPDIAPTGSITIVKIANPEGEQEFDFVPSFDDEFVLTDDGESDDYLMTFENVSTGEHTVTETVPEDWSITSIVCDDSDSTVDVQTGIATIQVAENEHVTCTFTNTKISTIIVKKITVPSGDAETFTFTGNLTGEISHDGTLENNVWSEGGPYPVTESEKEGWDLTDISCDDENSIGDIETNTATFNVEAGETVTCAFTNTKRASFSLEKFSDPEEGEFQFDLTGPEQDGIPAQYVFNPINPRGAWNLDNLLSGLYSLSETILVPSDWTGSQNIACSGDIGNSSSGSVASPFEFTLNPGEDMSCTVNNTKDALISGKKFEDMDADGTAGENQGIEDWEITATQIIADNPETEVDESQDTLTYTKTTNEEGGYTLQVPPGIYKICETLQDEDNWFQSYPTASTTNSISCGEDFYGYELTVAAGDNKNGNDFGNYRKGSISGYKYEDKNGNGGRDADEPRIEDFIIFLDTNNNDILDDGEPFRETDDEGFYSFENLTPGTYIVREVLQSGWIQTYPGSSSGSKHTVTVTSGEDEENLNFGNFELVDISGFKWDDTNGDGVWQKCEEQGEECVAEPGKQDIIVGLGRQNGDPIQKDGHETIPIEIIAMDLTGANGEFVISNVDRGHYKLFEETKSGWKATSPEPRADSFFDITYDLEAIAIGDPDFDLLRIGDPDFDLLRSSFFDVFVELSGHDVNQSEATHTIITTVPSAPLEFGNHQLAVISSETATSTAVETTSFTVSWTTDKPATSRVIYDTVSHPVLGDGACASPLETLNCYGYASSMSELDTAPKVVDHSVTVSGLTAGTTYYYRIISKASPESIGNEGTFTTSSSSSGGGGGGGGSSGGGSSSVSVPSSVPASLPNEVENSSQSVSEIIPPSDISVAPILALGSQPSENQDSTSEESSTFSPALQIIQTNEQTIAPINEQIAPENEQDEQGNKEAEEIIELPQISPFLANISTILTLGTDSNLPALLIIMLIFLGLAYFGNKVWQKEKNK